MRKFVFGTLVVLLFSACDELDKLTQFDMPFSEQVSIESATIIDLNVDIFTPDMQTNSESTFESNNTHKDLIEEIYLKSMRFTLTSPNDGDFNFLKEIRLFIAAEGLPDVEIANLTDIPNSGTKILDLETFSTDIKDFIKKDEFKFKVSTITDEVITQDCDIDIDAVMFVDAKILGQ